MKLNEIYRLAVEKGMEADPRGEDRLKKILSDRKKEYEKLDDKKKSIFDEQKLSNPYDDTRILWGDPNTEIKKVLAGIDIGGEEILLADRLREKGDFIDLIISHHPEGYALAGLYGVMDLQEDVLFKLGVPINIAEGLMEPRIKEVERNVLPLNHNRAVDMARILDIPFMCIHTPADNLVVRFLERKFEEKKPETLGDIIDVLLEIPEYKKAAQLNAGPKCVVGSEKNRAGKIFVDMTGGTSGSEKSYEKLAQAGIGTIIGMHMGEKHRLEAEKYHINVVIAGHIASDSLGFNLFLDLLEEKGIKIESCSGFIRHSRLQKGGRV
ncbi:MAG: NIF3 (NGG1p interacting factor 3)-like protein [Clostridia bacterium 41_269]|nr:MAG: NIF3 (NGG1p interacting factor 3)-like protein [Clostridia bacterium 41_269]